MTRPFVVTCASALAIVVCAGGRPASQTPAAPPPPFDPETLQRQLDSLGRRPERR